MAEDDGPAALRAAGVADDETSPDALLPLAGRSAELDLAIVGRLARGVDLAHATAIRDVAAGAERRGWKPVAKEARRVLYRFAQRGVVAPDVSPEPAALPRWTAAPLEGWVSGVDGRGDRLIWIVRAQPSGGLLAMHAILNEPEGLRDVTLAEVARKALRRMQSDLETRHHLKMMAADGAYCDALVAEGYERARAAGAAEAVGQYPTLRARLTSQSPAARDPPLITRVAGAAFAQPARADEAGRLLDERDFVTWALDRPTLAPYLEEIAAARDSPLVLSRPQQEERIQATLARARRELFGGARAAVYRRRLEEMAYYLWASDRRELAAIAAATAAGIARDDDALPFFTELLRRSVAAHMAEDEARARTDAEGSVLVRPGAPAARQRPR